MKKIMSTNLPYEEEFLASDDLLTAEDIDFLIAFRNPEKRKRIIEILDSAEGKSA